MSTWVEVLVCVYLCTGPTARVHFRTQADPKCAKNIEIVLFHAAEANPFWGQSWGKTKGAIKCTLQSKQWEKE